MLDKNKWNQYGFPREKDIEGITIHETGAVWNAKDLEDYLNNECKTSQGCHYIVDSSEVIQAMPDDWAVWHTGKGKDFGCQYTLAIEICSNLNDELFEEAVGRAISLVYSLQKKYRIPTENIFFHNDFNNRTYCPKTLLDRYGSSKGFVYQRMEGEQ